MQRYHDWNPGVDGNEAVSRKQEGLRGAFLSVFGKQGNAEQWKTGQVHGNKFAPFTDNGFPVHINHYSRVGMIPANMVPT